MTESRYDVLVHPNHALLKTVQSRHSEDAHNFDDTIPQQPESGTSKRSGSSVREGIMELLLLIILAVLVACMNHVLFTHLDKTELGTHASQFWVTMLKNMFPAAVALLLFMALKICLLQVALYQICLNSHSLKLVNLMTSPPSPLNALKILSKSSMRISLLCFALLAAISQAVALTSLLVPGTLAVVCASPHIQTLQIPSIDFTFVNPEQSSTFSKIWLTTSNPKFTLTASHLMLDFIEPSQKWQQLILRAASRSTAPTWDPPVGCGFACNYSFSYSAPALNCTELLKENIWPNGSNTSDSSLVFPISSSKTLLSYTFYNSTSSRSFLPNGTQLALDVVYMSNFNSIILELGQRDTNEWSPRGAHCIFQNALYEATTDFSNNTQVLSTRVKEWGDNLTTGPGGFVSAGTNTTNMTMALYGIAQAFSEILEGQASYSYKWRANDGAQALYKFIGSNTSTQALYTPLFNLTNHPAPSNTETSPDLTTFSLSSAFGDNLSAGLQSLLGNATLAFVNENMVTTNVRAMVTPNSLQYQYFGRKLALIYGIVFGVSLVVIAYGLFCLRRNGHMAVFDLQHILKMTATSSRLHESAALTDFGSTLVRGVYSLGLDGARHRNVVLEVSDALATNTFGEYTSR
ncbi:hypothetical protein D9757_004536 [Collybiopsis confluens]|uniref:Uncharacterized protein n=1 Tax=Collybiopsis confluens TaxID=2823264 RepID=A0A8H5MDY3_9AGAR|nr:hypothetical protein D9757_004536 [Collybiopsis confluens]